MPVRLVWSGLGRPLSLPVSMIPHCAELVWALVLEAIERGWSGGLGSSLAGCPTNPARLAFAQGISSTLYKGKRTGNLQTRLRGQNSERSSVILQVLCEDLDWLTLSFLSLPPFSVVLSFSFSSPASLRFFVSVSGLFRGHSRYPSSAVVACMIDFYPFSLSLFLVGLWLLTRALSFSGSPFFLGSF